LGMNYKQRLRLRIVLWAIILAAVVLTAALYRIQIVKGDSYIVQADKQYAKPATGLFDRGTIYFVSKGGTLSSAASIAHGHTIYINPKQLTNQDQAYQALSTYIAIDKDEFVRKAARFDDPYEELVRKVPQEIGEAIEALSITGVGVLPEAWRVYPGGNMASQTLGILGENNNGKVEGRYGLESAYEKVLRRSDSATGLNVFVGIFSGLRDNVFGSVKTVTGDIVSTIEPTVQSYLEKVLFRTDKIWDPNEIGGLIMDPRTGDIVALASLPSFDPNDLSLVKNPAIFSNPLVEHVYEMGSIVKPLTMAVALDTGAVTPDSTYEDTGTMTLNGKTIGNYDGVARGQTTMQEILDHSLNMGAATIALKVGRDIFADYFQRLALGQKTGIDQPNEARGIIGNLTTGRDIETATAAYGQGIAVSPIAMARALSALGNGGYLVEPHLVSSINREDGTVYAIETERSRQIFKKESTDQVTRMLVRAVDVALRGGRLKMEHYSIAAKTGTAQIADRTTGGYYSDRYTHSFFGYFPAYDPKFLIFLYQIQPKGTNYASDTLTDPFGELVKFLINYYDIPPDR